MPEGPEGLAGLRDRRLRAASSRMEGTARPAEPGCGAWRRRPWAARPGWDVHSNEKPHRCGGCRRGRRAWPGFEIDHSEPQVHAWKEPRGPRGLRNLAEVPVGGGRAWPGFEIDDSEPQVHAWKEPRGPRGPRSRAAAHRHTQPHNNQHPQRHEAATGFPATASSRSISAAQNDGTAQVDATQQSGTVSDQAVMSTWSSTAARPASRRATGTRNGEQDT